ncbi:MAG: hybrid sensor histidine kinase/response regulator [Bacteroidota bacterium]
MRKSKKEKVNILVVEDDKKQREAITRLLSKLEVSILSVGSGQEALSILLREHFVLVLIDVNMPEMNGIEMAALMQDNPSTAHIPIIFMTAYSQDEFSVKKGYQLGAYDYLFKPLKEEILLAKINMFLRYYELEEREEQKRENVINELKVKNQELKQSHLAALNIMEDVNEAKNQLKEKAEELERANKELNQFAYVATHDLRAPLMNLKGYIDVYQKRTTIPENNQEIFGKIRKNVDRINETLTDLITVVALKKTLDEEVKAIDFETALSDVLAGIEDQVKATQAQVTWDFSEISSINYIPSHIRSILQNFLTNAIKYKAPERKPIIKVHAKKSEGTVILSVTDNGIGIDPHFKDQVFGLFSRIHTDKVEGKGIGLYITKSQVESLGGSVGFDSLKGKGSTFKVYLKNQAIKEKLMVYDS